VPCNCAIVPKTNCLEPHLAFPPWASDAVYAGLRSRMNRNTMAAKPTNPPIIAPTIVHGTCTAVLAGVTVGAGVEVVIGVGVSDGEGDGVGV